MGNKPISTQPVTDNDKLLREKFYLSITKQSDLMDKLSVQLLTLELAIPGIYATIVKLIGGDTATVTVNPAFYVTFACWLAALLLTILALIPKKWIVDPLILKQDPQKFAEGLGIEDFFNESAKYKRRLIIASSVLFFIGTFSAALSIG